MQDLNGPALDRYITGNYGADQYDEWPEHVPCVVHGQDCDADTDVCEPDVDFDEPDPDSLPGGWDYEEPEDMYYPEPDDFLDDMGE